MMTCHCEHCHHDHCEGEHEEENRKVMILRLSASALLLVLALALPVPGWAQARLCLLAWAAAGYDVVFSAVRNILHGEVFDEMFLMTVASVGAFALGEYAEGVAVLLLFQIGELFQDYAVDKSRASIGELMDIRPDAAFVERDGTLVKIAPEDAAVGDIMQVKPGERVPLDGEIIAGESTLNTVALTGESAPRRVRPGDQALSGCINLTGLLRVRVTKLYADSTVARILQLVEEAGDRKSKADRFITRFARVYTPAVVAAALAVAVIPPLFTGAWAEWVRRALTFLVISCPCALVISVPLTYFSGIGGASRKGILIKGANYLESLAYPAAAAFDKTGTLTRGEFAVTEIRPVGCESDELLAWAAGAEAASNHPIALALRKAGPADLPAAEDVQEMAGHGVCARVDGRRVAVGNKALMEKEGAACPDAQVPGTVAHVAVDGRYAGYIVIADALKENAAAAVRELHGLGVRNLVMLTGDSAAAAEPIAAAAGVDAWHAQLLPGDKVDLVEQLMDARKPGETLLFVGDGINDAPVLARADVGVAMGALGADAAIEAADVVLMDDDPLRLCTAIRIARATRAIVRQNIVFSLAVKAAVMAFGALGMASLWAAVFADVGVCFLAILNAMRAFRAA